MVGPISGVSEPTARAMWASRTKSRLASEKSGGQIEAAKQAGTIPTTRYDLKLWIGDLHEGAAYLPH
jgi:hypothetical protein